MKTITAEELKNLMDTEDVIVINVLNPDAFEQCRIIGSINIPVHDKEGFREKIKKLDKGKKVIVYCASYECPASGKAYDEIVTMEVFDKDKLLAYEGGIKEWKEKGLPTEGTRC